ncbi:hypothetical protein CGCS363_v003439 [Colletotrichum siamense]|uniref:uncharacterized protein n=1 Tax=Colletotrichum siamense TaxID=690259 RepID=UPI001872B2B8|nr:uncharacterized protein CGCS363_v003439 [Colletotrichum siamense]KAF5510986.1 hypothetical protein CGCS363_v003439 [Colletotrichum siamense]
MTDQVGFGFQADVVSTASLSHMLTGRVLKALSDGGVDTYAVAAAFWLGAKVPVRSSLSDTVHSHVSRRCGMQSVLSKALSIGWGHSVPVVEMTRTRAGTNALLVIGSLSTGTPPFQAAQCLSQLLSVYGLGAEMLPSVDVLKGLVAYLAPFVHDLGFPKVLQHIDSTAARYFETSRSFGPGERGAKEESRRNKVFGQLRRMGSAENLAKAIKQLVFTAERGQSHYMILNVRGSWLPAFASHILGMSVELRHGDTILWACGGGQGNVIFQLESDHTANHFSVSSSPQSLHIVPEASDWKENNQRVKIDYLLEETLEYQIARWSHLDTELSPAIHHAIRMLSMDLLDKTRITLFPRPEFDHSHAGFLMNGNFDNRRALEDVLAIMRVESPTTKRLGLPRKVEGFSTMGPATHGLAYLKEGSLKRVLGMCRYHYDSIADSNVDFAEDCGLGQCPCECIGRLIHGVSSTAVALTRCRFNPSELRVQGNILSGDTITAWSWSCLSIGRDTLRPHRCRNVVSGYSATHDEFFDHLGRLICFNYSDTWLKTDELHLVAGRKRHIVGLSGGAHTIYYSCIMQNDAFDELGRMIQISGGLASVGGAFRNIIIEPAEPLPEFASRNVPERLSDPSLLVGGSLLQPHHRPSLTNLIMDVSVNESSILLQLATLNDMLPRTSIGASFVESISVFLSLWAVPSCFHAKDAVYDIQDDMEVAVDGFHVARIVHQDIKAEVLVFALTGNKLEQLLTCGALSKMLPLGPSLVGRGSCDQCCGVLQLFSCLRCSIRLSRQPDKNIGLPCVVMGG